MYTQTPVHAFFISYSSTQLIMLTILFPTLSALIYLFLLCMNTQSWKLCELLEAMFLTYLSRHITCLNLQETSVQPNGSGSSQVEYTT